MLFFFTCRNVASVSDNTMNFLKTEELFYCRHLPAELLSPTMPAATLYTNGPSALGPARGFAPKISPESGW